MIETFFKFYALLGIAWAIVALVRFSRLIGAILAGKPCPVSGLTKAQADKRIASFDRVTSLLQDVSRMCPLPVLAIILAVVGIFIAIWDGMRWPFLLWKRIAAPRQNAL